MVLVKTFAGQQAFKERDGLLAAVRQRTAFILFDGTRRLNEVLNSISGFGITPADVHSMVEQGLLAPAEELFGKEGSRSAQQRYLDAYPLAVKLTADMGFRGLKLNLAVEAAKNYEDLAALAPKIRSVVGEQKYLQLMRALFA